MIPQLTTIIDGDSIVYIVAWKHRENSDDVDSVLETTNSFIKSLLDATGAYQYAGFLGKGKTFRHDLDSEYKAKRPKTNPEISRWSGIIKAHLRDHWKFTVVENIEADDALAILAYYLKENYTLCHNDKDMRQIPGNHFNLYSKKREYIEPLEAYRIYCKQIITGDPTDNIKGLKGKGKVFADKLLDDCTHRIEMLRRVVKAYKEHSTVENFCLQARLVKLCTIPRYGFVIPELIPWGTTGVVEKNTKSIEDIFAQWNEE